MFLHYWEFLLRFMCFFYFFIKSYDFWFINYLFGFNVKDNEVRCYNFDIVPCFELFTLLLPRLSKVESHIAAQIWSLTCLCHIMVYVYISVVYISFEYVYIYNLWEFCFINLRIVNYFVCFSNYAPAVRCWQHKHIYSIYIYIYIYIRY